MRFTKNLIAGLLTAGMLAIVASTTSAHGGGGGGGHSGGGGYSGGGGHFGRGGPFGGFRRGFARHGFYGYAGPWVYGAPGFYDYDDDGYPYDQDGDAFNEPIPRESVPQEATALTLAVQKELAHLGYYPGPLDGIAGPETERAIRRFQAIDGLPVTGQVDGATRQALRVD